MSEYSYLKPKVRTGNLGERQKRRGMFVNVPGYVKFGGFSSSDKVPKADDMALEKTPTAQKGKPI